MSIDIIIWFIVWPIGILTEIFLIFRARRRLSDVKTTSTPESFLEYETRVVAREHFIQEAISLTIMFLAFGIGIGVVTLESGIIRRIIFSGGLNLIGVLLVTKSILRYFGLERFIKRRAERHA